jgi:hypothetical protein
MTPSHLPRFLLTGVVRVYRFAISPMFPRSCRFEPSCSQYALEALERHGALHGSWLVVKRVGRCNPFVSGGFDPVPEGIRRGP